MKHILFFSTIIFSFLACSEDVAGNSENNNSSTDTDQVTTPTQPGTLPEDFDATIYLEVNPDLAELFGDDKDAAKEHYLSTGQKEGRAYKYPENGLNSIDLEYNGSGVSLSWNVDMTGFNSIIIYKSTTDVENTYKPIATVEGTYTTYTDKNIIPNSLYYYRLSTINTEGESPKTKAHSIQIPEQQLASTPVNITAKQKMDKTVTATCQLYGLFDSVFVYRSNSKNGTYSKISSVAFNTIFAEMQPYYVSYHDQTTQIGLTYYYKFQTYNMALENNALSAMSYPAGLTIE